MTNSFTTSLHSYNSDPIHGNDPIDGCDDYPIDGCDDHPIDGCDDPIDGHEPKYHYVNGYNNRNHQYFVAISMSPRCRQVFNLKW
ncbi:hypothetical protein SLS55_000566 [Diplodia seriata]|uniref:Uncharacterized protein n=1 Tax=Diplodia seriata TaxID=420778 RepID=A0ABR3CUN1_9PEZI